MGHTDIRVPTHTHMHTHTHTRAHGKARMHTHTHTRTHGKACVHTCTHNKNAYTYTHVHTCARTHRWQCLEEDHNANTVNARPHDAGCFFLVLYYAHISLTRTPGRIASQYSSACVRPAAFAPLPGHQDNNVYVATMCNYTQDTTSAYMGHMMSVAMLVPLTTCHDHFLHKFSHMTKTRTQSTVVSGTEERPG